MAEQQITIEDLQTLIPGLQFPTIFPSKTVSVSLIDVFAPKFNPEKKLMKACEDQNAEIVKTILKNKLVKDLEKRIHNISFLEAASCKSSCYITKLLIEHGAVIDSVDKRNRSPLFMSMCNSKNLDNAKLLIAHGANVNSARNDGQTMLMAVLPYDNRKELIKFLLDAGADIEAKDQMEKSIMDYTAAYPEVLKMLADKLAGAKQFYCVCKDGKEFQVLEPVKSVNYRAICLVSDKSTKILMRTVSVKAGTYTYRQYESAMFVDHKKTFNRAFTIELPVDPAVQVDYHCEDDAVDEFVKFYNDIDVTDDDSTVDRHLGEIYRVR